MCFFHILCNSLCFFRSHGMIGWAAWEGSPHSSFQEIPFFWMWLWINLHHKNIQKPFVLVHCWYTSPCHLPRPPVKPGSLGAYKGFSDMNAQNNATGHKYSTWSRGPTKEVLPNRQWYEWHMQTAMHSTLICRHLWHVLITSQFSHQPNHHLNTPITQSGGYPRGLSNNTVTQRPLLYHVPHGMPISRYTPTTSHGSRHDPRWSHVSGFTPSSRNEIYTSWFVLHAYASWLDTGWAQVRNTADESLQENSHTFVSNKMNHPSRNKWLQPSITCSLR